MDARVTDLLRGQEELLRPQQILYLVNQISWNLWAGASALRMSLSEKLRVRSRFALI